MNEIDSIDSISEKIKNKLGLDITDLYENVYNIPVGDEFWAHCSNFQVWYEND